MPDEPRRSGRATKGQHTKKQDTPEDVEPKKASTKSKVSKKAAAEQASNGTEGEEEEEEEEDAYIRCLCGTDEDEGGRMMICCDNCSAWQHNDCMGLSEDPDNQPESYWCEQCRPEDHKELLAAIARGEKPWEETARRREEAEAQQRKGGRKGKPGRPPKAKSVEAKEEEAAESSQVTSGVAGNKRKRADEAPRRTSQGTSRTATDPPAAQANMAAKRRKSSTLAATTADASHRVDDIAALPNESRQRVAEQLKSRFIAQIEKISKSGAYRIPDGHTPSSLGTKFGLLVEYALFTNHCGSSSEPTEAYKSQFRAIAFNVKKNPVLMEELLNGELLADQLATMDSDDMASDELKQRMVAMKEEADAQAVLIREDGPRIRRTHKGEELVDDETQQEVNESIVANAPPRPRDSDAHDGEGSPQSPGALQRSGSMAKDGTHHMSPGRNKSLSVDTGTHEDNGAGDRRSSHFDITSVWSSVQSPSGEPKRLLQQPPRRASSGVQQPNPSATLQHDDDIDRLLEDEENDFAPYSPSEYTEQSSVWRGRLQMLSVGNFIASARHIAGAEPSGIPLSSIFPKSLEIDGRIDKARADGYLSSLSAARSTDVTVLQLQPEAHGAALQEQFNTVFDYFAQRKRYGVVSKNPNENVRDTYIIPIEAGSAPLPDFLTRLAFNVIEQPRPQRMLLITFVLRYRTPAGSAHATPREQSGTAMSPSAPKPPSALAMSPVTVNSPASFQQYSPIPPQSSNGFPGNPYTPSPVQSQLPYQHRNAPAHTDTLAYTILGDLANTPVAQQVLKAQPQQLPEQTLNNLRNILIEYPRAREDMTFFTEILAQQNS